MFTVPLTYLIQAISNVAAACSGGSFFGLPTWYKYLDSTTDRLGVCTPTFQFPSGVWLVGMAVIEILLRIGGLVAVAYVMYGSIRYITSQGESEGVSAAKSTIMNALIGLAIVLIAIVAVNFLGAQLTS